MLKQQERNELSMEAKVILQEVISNAIENYFFDVTDQLLEAFPNANPKEVETAMENAVNKLHY